MDKKGAEEVRNKEKEELKIFRITRLCLKLDGKQAFLCC